MNYFEIFELPVVLKVDRNLARRKYFELSRKTHPDYFVQQGPEAQQHALESSALLNKALRTLSDPDETIRYVLELKGLIGEEEKHSLPQGFLMQMLEINEELADLQFDPDPGKKTRLEQRLSELEKELYEPVQKIIENYREDLTTEEELLQVKDYYFKKKYLLRLHRPLDGIS
jgi:molecular chaperone HscB